MISNHHQPCLPTARSLETNRAAAKAKGPPDPSYTRGRVLFLRPGLSFRQKGRRPFKETE